MTSPSPMKSPDRDAADELIAAIILDICELPDRTSPDDRPEDVTLSVTELRGVLERHLPSELATLRRRVAEMEPVVRQLVEAVDAGQLQMSSPEIGEPENDIPLHPWHEELLHYARAAIAPLPPGRNEPT